MLGALIVAALLGGGAAQTSDGPVETYVCWVEARFDADIGLPRDLLVCRIAGELVVFEDRSGVPVLLHPAVLRDVTGSCWYWRSEYTGWIIVGREGSAVLLSRDTGGLLLFDARVERCVSEPAEEEPPIELVWRVVRRYPAPVPEVEVDPPVTVTGLVTFVKTQPPLSVTDTITSPVTGRTVTVVLEVTRVAVGWGDGSHSVVGRDEFPGLVGHPGGTLHHVYETRGRYSVVVVYHRAARWRVGGEGWRRLELGPAATVVPLGVDELVARRVA